MRGSSPLARGLRARRSGQPSSRGIIPARAGFTATVRAAGLSRRDHPRSRGVYKARPPYAGRALGSSPLARGLLPARPGDGLPALGSSPLARGLRRQRPCSCRPGRDHPRSRGVYVVVLTEPALRRWIIPARAGFTHRHPGRHGRGRDHPRSRGVYADAWIIHAAWAGSSPLARGLPPRVTPQREAAPDHPRSRGVYCTICVTPMRRRGSSPLARGLLLPGIRDMIQSGIIPARAGFTSSSSRQSTGSWDHPRSRGVYCHWGACPASRSGSSPLARGLLPLPAPRHPSPGIIPARAGFTPLRYHLVPERQDHPRSRGVYSVTPPPWRRHSGSSPLARGLQERRRPLPRGRRIIPARAGFTIPPVDRLLFARDHPRSRGVYLWLTCASVSPIGSSPLARGLQRPPSKEDRAPMDHPRSRGVYCVSA